MRCHLTIPITEASQIGEARRSAVRIAEEAKLNPTDCGRVSIVATELATNLVRHSHGGGELLVFAHENPKECSVEMTAFDLGPGMTDVDRCLQDGFSTGGTAGNGLGAVRRLSDQMDLFSSPGGTVIWSCIKTASQSDERPRFSFAAGAVALPMPGETACGDAWRIARADGRLSLLVVDGLGHGTLASDAAEAACKVFDQNPFEKPKEMIEAAHTAISGTRGSAMSVALIDSAAGQLTYAGVGNIAGTLLDASGSRGLFSHNGIVGHQMRRAQEMQYPWTPQSILVLHSDGIKSRWALDHYPGLARRRPAVIAAVLYRDFKRGRDDATVVAVCNANGVK